MIQRRITSWVNAPIYERGEVKMHDCREQNFIQTVLIRLSHTATTGSGTDDDPHPSEPQYTEIVCDNRISTIQTKKGDIIRVDVFFEGLK